MKCKTCNKELSKAELKNRDKECNCCRMKRKDIREFIVACNKFKQRIGYDEVLRNRERRNEIFNQKV